MIRQRSIYRCQSCSMQSAKWMGQCTNCHEWDTLQETTPSAGSKNTHAVSPLPQLAPLNSNMEQQVQTRIMSRIEEWDRVLGGGIVRGSFLMLTGDPGIGKSTLLLQVAHKLAEEHSVIYFSSEESRSQVRARAERINCLENQLLFSDEIDIETIVARTIQERPDMIIIDSLQNCASAERESAPGSISHLRDIASRLLRLAKSETIAILLSGHITKDGTLAGPKLLEHMVDAVFYLQGEERWQGRMLRAVKNRFGTIDEIGFFEMREQGLEEVGNFNEQVLAEASYAPGSALVSSLEGTRPLLVELQALTIASHFAMPQRLVTGIDQKQVILIASILEKYLNIPFSKQDIFFKVSGGIKLKGSGSDLGVALALISSYLQEPLPPRWLAIGEISLTGHVKPVNQLTAHITEARKFGLNKICLAKQQRVDLPTSLTHPIQTVYELLKLFSKA